jgi:ketosteroid isomerase-like protein
MAPPGTERLLNLKITNQSVVGVLCLFMLSVAFAQKPDITMPIQPSVPLPPDLAKVLTDYEKAWSSKDAAALAQLFVEDGFVLSPGHSMVRGRAAIERFYTGSGGPLSLRAVAFATKGSVGYIIGAYAAKPSAPDDGKFTLTLQRGASGRWMIFSDMDNANRPWQPEP